MSVNSRHRKWDVSGSREPESILRWRRYADPINRSLMEKWRNGDTRPTIADVSTPENTPSAPQRARLEQVDSTASTFRRHLV